MSNPLYDSGLANDKRCRDTILAGCIHVCFVDRFIRIGRQAVSAGEFAVGLFFVLATLDWFGQELFHGL